MNALINLTPHSITISNPEGSTTFDPSGIVARVRTEEVASVLHGSLGNLKVTTSRTGETQGLPPEEEGTLYIVSMIVRTSNPHRKDLVSPGFLLRDAEGNVIGADGLVANV